MKRGRHFAPLVLITLFALLVVATAHQEHDWEDHADDFSSDESSDDDPPPQPHHKCNRFKSGCSHKKGFRKGWFKKMLKHVAKKAKGMNRKMHHKVHQALDSANQALRELKRSHDAPAGPREAMSTELLEILPVKRLKQLLKEAGVESTRGMVEKSELVAKLCQLSPGCEESKKKATEHEDRDRQLLLITQILSKLHSKVDQIESVTESSKHSSRHAERTAIGIVDQFAELSRKFKDQISSLNHKIAQLESKATSQDWAWSPNSLIGMSFCMLLLGLLLLVNYYLWYAILSVHLRFGAMGCSLVRRAINPVRPAINPQQGEAPSAAERADVPIEASSGPNIPAAAQLSDLNRKAPQHKLATEDQAACSKLRSMGFPDDAQIQQALLDTSSDVEAAALILSDSSESDLSTDKLQESAAEATAEAPSQPPEYASEDESHSSIGAADEDAWPTSTMQELEQMGFPDVEANTCALQEADGNITFALKKLIANERCAR